MKNKKSFLDKTSGLLKNQNFQVIILVLAVILETLIISNLLNQRKHEECFCLDDFFETEDEVGQPRLQERMLDGVIVADDQPTSTRPLAVIIENHFEARPQTGLAEANLVYEFLTEGGITRLLGFYDGSTTLEKIGPVRSCRPYFLDVAEEFQSIFAHVGGSPGCLDDLKRRAYDVYDLNQYFKDDYFWRDKKALPPHNVYTSSKLLNKYLVDRDIEGIYNLEPWIYKDDQLDEGVELAQEITIDYSVNAYKVDWLYDQKKNDYLRYTADDPQKDKDGTEIRAKNIIVQYTKTWLLDSIGRLGMKLEGRGEAIIFLDGKVILGYWKKEKRGERTRYYTNDDEEVKLNRGPAWIEIVPTDRAVRY